jgi:phospholipid transport system substrate-binding protein
MWMRILLRPVAALAVLVLGVCAGSNFALAQAADPAIATIDGFDNALLDTMKQATSLGPKGRYQKLTPAVQRAFNLPAMARFAVGPNWSQYNAADRQSLVDAFTRLTIASYAHNFDGYGGEHFEISPNVQTRGLDKIVQTKLIRPRDKPVALNYRMRQEGGTWKVIDIYYGNISQLSIRRADFANSATVGAGALIHDMTAQANKLEK